MYLQKIAQNLIEMDNRKEHWEKIYASKNFEETSWYQSIPEASLNLIESLGLARDAGIIDIGGGNSYLVDNLLELGYTNLNVLDISEKAIENVRTRLGKKSDKVNWIVSDASEYKSDKKFEVWHDRAAFHFLTEDEKIQSYIKNLKNSLEKGGYFILATFSEKGPLKCSGIEIKQYSQEDMRRLFEKDFEAVRIENMDHATPWDATQNFTFGLFRRK